MITILFLYDSTKPSITRKLAGVYDAARAQNWNVQAIEGTLTAKKIRDLLAFWHPDGVIVECGSATNQVEPSAFGKTPAVYLDRNPKTLDTPAFCVSHDSKATAQVAARELLSLRLTSYAYVPWPEPRFWSEERETGFSAALKLNGKGYARFEGKVRAGDTIRLQSRLAEWLVGLAKPVGVFAANDAMAAHVLAAAGHAKLSVPQEVAVIGVDNNEMACENTHPSLSSIVPDFRQAGVKAAEMLAARLANPRLKPRTETFGPLQLVRRSSTSRTAKTDPLVLSARDLIRCRACGGLTAREVAATFPCSRRMAEIRFRAATGHSILDEIQSVRRAKAEELLKDPTLDANAVANFCGYSSANALRNFLRQHRKKESA